MYKHHKESLEIMKNYFKKQDIIALIFWGSAVKENACPDSDFDAMVVVLKELYKRKQ